MLSNRPGVGITGERNLELYLKYPDAEIQLESVLKKISESLATAGAPYGREIAIAALALIVETRNPGTSAVDHANRCLSDTRSARLMQSVVLPGRPRTSYSVNLGAYTIKAFNPDKLLYWAQRCKSAYPIDLRELKGWAALEREPVEVVLVDWTDAGSSGPLLSRWGPQIASDYFLDNYYSEVAHAFAQEISSRLKRDVLVLESGAMLWIGIDTLLDALFLKTVSYFVWKTASGTVGWATFSDKSGLHVNFPPQEGVQSCREWLSTELGFTGLSDSNPLDRGIRTYCRFLQRAHGHRFDGRPDEAFLHFAIALDLLLGSEGRSSDSVAQRVALIVYRQTRATLEEAMQRLKRLYAVRSKYVHEGRSVSPTDLRDIETACTEVLWALLSVSSHAKITDVEEWIRRIDYLFSGVRAGMTLPEFDFQLAGIPPVGHARQPPLRVED